MNTEEYVQIFKAFSHPVRLMIACGVLCREKCNVNTMSAKLGLSQSLVSQHTNILKNAGIIKGYRVGNIIWYRFENDLAKKILENINLPICEKE